MQLPITYHLQRATVQSGSTELENNCNVPQLHFSVCCWKDLVSPPGKQKALHFTHIASIVKSCCVYPKYGLEWEKNF